MWQSTLADSFLADFDEEEDEDEVGEEQERSQERGKEKAAEATAASDGTTGASLSGSGDAADGEEADEEDAASPALPLSTAPSSLSHLLTSDALSSFVASLPQLLASSHVSPEREMAALSSSIRFIAAVDSEVLQVHRFLRHLYGLRFSELEQLVSSPVDYASTALTLGNFTGDAVGLRAKEKRLQSFLPHNVVLTVTVTATTSGGRLLSDDEWQRVEEASNSVLTLHQHRSTLLSYMESRMALIAPNLSALVGSTVAAHLLSVAGGLRRLSEIPSCNLQVLGTRKQRQTGLSSVTQDLHVGVIGQSAILQACPTSLRRRAVRLLAGKVTLACRVDEFQEERSGEKGRQLRREVEAKIERWQEPPPSSLTKALPAPLAQSNKRRRGGKRYRKERERSQLSELHKGKHRMAFGKEELVDEYTGEEFGMIGQEGSGSVKVTQASTTGQKLSQRLSRDMKKRLGYGQGKAAGGTLSVAGGVGGTASVGGAVTVIGGGGGGTASSIAFTPVQGMELVNNEHKRLKAESGVKYFASTATFSKVGPQAAERKPLPPVPTF